MWYCTGFHLILLLFFINQKNKKMKKLFLLAVLFTAIFTSCKKDSTPDPVPAPIVYPEENFMDGYLSATGFSEKTTSQVNLSDYEFGNEFIPTVKGKITSLKIKLPDVNSSVRVTLWDKATTTIIKTEIINVAAANILYTVDIVDINLVKDKEYAISMNSNDWYDRRKTSSANATYPVTVGNIKITSYTFRSGTAQSYPNSPQLSYYAGDVSFNFQRTE
jgi:hypothetical protein